MEPLPERGQDPDPCMSAGQAVRTGQAMAPVSYQGPCGQHPEACQRSRLRAARSVAPASVTVLAAGERPGWQAFRGPQSASAGSSRCGRKSSGLGDALGFSAEVSEILPTICPLCRPEYYLLTL